MQSLLSVRIRSYFTQYDVCRKMGQMYQSIVEHNFSVEVTHHLRIVLMNNTPLKNSLLIIIIIHVVDTPPPLSTGGTGVEPPTKFSKRGGLTGPQLLEGGHWERGGGVTFFMGVGGIAIFS